MPDQEATLRLTMEDNTAAALRSVSRNVLQMGADTKKGIKTLEDGTKINIAQVKKFAEQTGVPFKQMMGHLQQNAQAAKVMGSNLTALGNAATGAGGAARVFGSALSGAAVGLATSAAGALSAAAAFEVLRRSFMGFANYDNQLRLIQNQTGLSRKSIDALGDSMKRLSSVTGDSVDDLLAGFEQLREAADIAPEAALKLMPNLTRLAAGSNMQLRSAGRAVGDVMRNLKIPAEEAIHIMEAMSHAAKEYNLDLSEVGPKLSELTTMASAWGYTGKAGFASVITTLGAIKKATGDATTAASLYSNMLANMGNEQLGTALGYAPGKFYEEMRKIAELGDEGDVVGAMIERIIKAQDPEAVMRILGIREKKVIEALKGVWGSLGTTIEKTAKARGMWERGQNVIEGPARSVMRLTAAFNELGTSIGYVLDTIGVTTGIEALATILTTIARTVEKIIAGMKKLSDMLPKGVGAEAGKSILKVIPGLGPVITLGDVLQRLNIDPEEAKKEQEKLKQEEEKKKKDAEEAKKFQNLPTSEPPKLYDDEAPKKSSFITGGGGDTTLAGGTRYGGSGDARVLKASYMPSGGGYLAGGGGGGGPGGIGGGTQTAGPGGSGTGYGGSTPGAMPSSGGQRHASLPPPGAPAEAGGGGGGAAGGDLDRGAYDKMFKGTPLEGKYDTVVAEAQKNNVPPSLMAGILAHETGKGTSKMLRDKNNPAGLMDPKTGWKTGQSFGSVDEGIAAAGRTIGKNYQKAGGDVGQMAKRYAPVGAANDPGGLNQHWQKGVTGYQKQMATPGGGTQTASVGPSPVGPSPPGTGANQGLSASVDEAMKMVGLNESKDQQLLMKYMKTGGRGLSGEQNAWCAAFVNGVVAQAGMKGTDSWQAKSFLKWGKSVGAKDEVLKGDVFVFDRGRDPAKGHVGIHTGQTRKGKGGETEYEMLQGNTGGAKAGGGAVGKTWHTRAQIKAIRRGEQPAGRPPANVASPAPAAPSPAPGGAPAPTPETGGTPPAPGRIPSSEERYVNLNLKVNDTQMQFARSSMRRSADREVREARWNSYSDIGAA